LFASALEELK